MDGPEAEGAADAARMRRDPFFNERGLRSGWRLGLWILAVILLNAVGSAVLHPFAGTSQVAWFGLMAAVATVAGWGMLALQGKPLGALGWAADPAAPRDFGLGFGAGAVLILAAVGVLGVAGSVRWVAAGGTASEYGASLAGSFGLFLVAAAAEEAVFRGYGFQALVEGLGPWPATAIMSLLFGAVHSDNPDFGSFGFANIVLAGVLLSVLYLRTRSLWLVTALHMGWNWTMAALHFPVSGLPPAMPLFRVAESGADWWTGGGFGPEAGLAATLVLAAGVAWAMRTPLLRESEKMRALGPLVDHRIGPEWPR
jgi:membrane protease YdiL (CAAX protease family)